MVHFLLGQKQNCRWDEFFLPVQDQIQPRSGEIDTDIMIDDTVCCHEQGLKAL